MRRKYRDADRYGNCPTPHYQCECMNAGCKGRLCDRCGTPFEWLATDEDWLAHGPLPGDDGTEPWNIAAQRARKAREG